MSAAEIVFVPRLTSEARPVFHYRGVSRPLRAEIPRGFEWRSLCGIAMVRVGYDGITRVDKARLRVDHAQKIGRVCESCYRIDASRKGYDV